MRDCNDGCRCCVWSNREIAVPSGEHIMAHRMWVSGEIPRDKCQPACGSVNRWIGGRWAAGGNIHKKGTASDLPRIGRLYGNDSVFLFKVSPTDGPSSSDLRTEIAVGPSGEFAIASQTTLGIWTYDASGTLLASNTTPSTLTLPGVCYDAAGNLWVASAGSENSLSKCDPATLAPIDTFVPPIPAPQDGAPLQRLFRPRFDRTTGYICGALRVVVSTWTSYPVSTNPISNKLGWLGFGGSVAWRVDVSGSALGSGYAVKVPVRLSVYAQSDLTTPIKTFYPFKDSTAGVNPGEILDADVDESDRIVVVGRSGCRKAIHVYDDAGDLVLAVGYGAIGSDFAGWGQQQPTCCCWGPEQDRIIAGSTGPARRKRWPYPGTTECPAGTTSTTTTIPPTTTTTLPPTTTTAPPTTTTAPPTTTTPPPTTTTPPPTTTTPPPTTTTPLPDCLYDMWCNPATLQVDCHEINAPCTPDPAALGVCEANPQIGDACCTGSCTYEVAGTPGFPESNYWSLVTESCEGTCTCDFPAADPTTLDIGTTSDTLCLEGP